MEQEVLRCTAEDVARVRKHFGKDVKKIKEDVQILRTWMEQQQHLPQNADDDFLERVLLRNKFRMEQAKKKLDNYYTLKGIYREFFKEHNAEVKPSRETSLYLPLPRMTPSSERILLFMVRSSNPEPFSFTTAVRNLLLAMEIVMRKDYSVGDVLIMDFKGVTMDEVKKITITELSRGSDLYLRGYSGRLSGLHLINTPSYINIVMAVFRVVLSDKLFGRVKIHKDLHSLHQYFDKKILPRDFGGELESLDEIMKKWDNLFESYYQFFDANYHVLSNEKLRVGDVPQNDVFGVDGTFRKLNLD